MPDFDKIIRQLLKSARAGDAEMIAAVRRLCPGIILQIEADRGPSGPGIFWGDCRNLDELAGQVIVEPSILQTIFQIAGRRLSPEHPHAGYQHTYGYLFSVIETPYGKKRDRWVRTDLESALGLPLDVLGPAPNEGTLLANATWLAGSIAFRGHKRLHWMHRCLSRRAAQSVQELEPEKWRSLRLTETVPPANLNSLRSDISLITDFVRLPFADKSGIRENWLLVYSIESESSGTPRLITLFTVTDAFVESVRERAATRKRTDIRARYNAFVPGLTNEPQAGTVRLTARSE